MDEIILAVTRSLDRRTITQRLEAADVAFGSVNSVKDLSIHPALKRRRAISSAGQNIDFPARPISQTSMDDAHDEPSRSTVPGLGQHSDIIRKEFSGE